MNWEPIIYDNAAVAIAGHLLVESTGVTVQQVHDGDQVINILGGGSTETAFLSPGARHTRVSFEGAVPCIGSGNWLSLVSQIYLDAERCLIEVFLLGSKLSLASYGYLEDFQLKTGVGASSVLSLSFIGQAKGFE